MNHVPESVISIEAGCENRLDARRRNWKVTSMTLLIHLFKMTETPSHENRNLQQNVIVTTLSTRQINFFGPIISGFGTLLTILVLRFV